MTDAPDQALIDQFKAGMDDSSAAAMATRLTDAEAKLAELAAKPDLTADLAAANERADAAEKARDDLAAQLSDATGKLTDANKAIAAVTARDAAAKPLKLAPGKDPKPTDPDDVAAARAALRDQIAKADTVEIAFSDGRQQIADLGTRVVTGEAWKDSPLGLMLSVPVDLFGAGIGGSPDPVVVAGYALLLDGKAASYTARDPLNVPAGGHVRLEDDIYF